MSGASENEARPFGGEHSPVRNSTDAKMIDKIPSHRSDELPAYIQIDRQPFAVDTWTLTGAQLRYLPNPPIADRCDLWKVNPGEQDTIVLPETVVDLHGARFFTSPKIINAGASGHSEDAMSRPAEPFGVTTTQGGTK